jgi:hypothetical protein
MSAVPAKSITIRKAERLDFAPRVERIAVDNGIEHLGSLLGAIDVEFDSVPPAGRRVLCHFHQRPAFTSAGIDDRTAGTEHEPPTYLLRNRIRQRVKIHPNPCIVARHGGSP